MFMGREFYKIILTLSCAALFAGGCASTEEEKQDELISTLRMHVEVSGIAPDFSVPVQVGRESATMVTVDKEPFLTEADVAEARLVEVAGGFDLLVQFDHHGSLLLEQYTTSNPGRRLVIFCLFGKTPADHRWLAAPTISRRITSGTLTFTPDASRAETERIALGLNNVAKKNRERNKW